jgi:hypothetical protein
MPPTQRQIERPTEKDRPREHREDTEGYERRVRIGVSPQRPADDDCQRCEPQRDPGDFFRPEHDKKERESKSVRGHHPSPLAALSNVPCGVSTILTLPGGHGAQTRQCCK